MFARHKANVGVSVCPRQQRPPRITTICSDTWEAIGKIRLALSHAWRDYDEDDDPQDVADDDNFFSLRGAATRDFCGGATLVLGFALLMLVAAAYGGA